MEMLRIGLTMVLLASLQFCLLAYKLYNTELPQKFSVREFSNATFSGSC